MRQVNIFKAQGVGKYDGIEPVTINIHDTLPEVTSLDEWRELAKKEAAELADALCNALPQGVTDALMVELLDRKRSLFVIPMPKREG